MQNILKRLNFQNLKIFSRHYLKLNENSVNTIKAIVGPNNFSSAEAIRTHHSKDESFHRFVMKYA